MVKKALCLSLILLMFGGCGNTTRRERPFTKEWAHQVDKEREFQVRKVRIEGKKALTSDGGAIGFERKERPDIGKKDGLGVDLDKGGGTIKYGITW